MHTARLPTVCRCFGGHQMSVLVGGGGLYSEVQLTRSLNRTPVMATRCHKQGAGAKGGLMSEGLGKGHPKSHVWSGGLDIEVQCIVGNGHIRTLSPWTEWQTDTCEKNTFPQLRWRAVITNLPAFLWVFYPQLPVWLWLVCVLGFCGIV